ncbi:hypothetical protein CHS0354_037274 [Potamilus streckersoni]|uniref:Uncharacterized protein n=1 Tax=Potamilus streckersoni TaxID=2493646 RepID=A0AAE0W2L6_9BIVA|nr:hypothetical protein CHS0354_037274 [Potamilus streckersoni]
METRKEKPEKQSKGPTPAQLKKLRKPAMTTRKGQYQNKKQPNVQQRAAVVV